MLHTTITNNKTAEPASTALHSAKMFLQQNAKLKGNINNNTVYKVNTSHEHNKNGNIYYNDYYNGSCDDNSNSNSKLKYVSSSVPRNGNGIDFFGGDDNTSTVMSSKKKKNKKKQNNNFFDIEFLPYNHFYIERERKKKERMNQFEGLMIIKKISQSNIIEAESLYNNYNHNNNMYPKIKLKFDGHKNNSNYNSINAKPISSYRKNRFAFNNNNNNNKNNSVVNNSSSNGVGNNNISNSINTSKQSVVINHEVIEKKKQRMEKAVKNYYTDEKPLTTCGNMSRSHNNALVLGLNKDKDKENMNNVSVNQKYTYKYKVNSNNTSCKVVNNSSELKTTAQPMYCLGERISERKMVAPRTPKSDSVLIKIEAGVGLQ